MSDRGVYIDHLCRLIQKDSAMGAIVNAPMIRTAGDRNAIRAPTWFDFAGRRHEPRLGPPAPGTGPPT